MKLTDIIKEYIVNKPDPKRPPALLEVVKDRYLCTDRTREGDYYTKREVDDTFFHMFVVGDVWKLKKNGICMFPLFPNVHIALVEKKNIKRFLLQKMML